MPKPAAIGKVSESDSFFTKIANIIRKNDWVRATTGPTNETAPVEIAL